MNRRDLTKCLVAATVGTAFKTVRAQSSPLLKFSVMLWTLPKDMAFAQRLELVAKAGYAGVELVGEFHQWSAADTQRYKAQLDSLGLVVDAASGVKAGFAVPSQTGEFLTQFRTHLDALHALGCHRAILLSGPMVAGMSKTAQQQTAVENLSKAADLAAQAGVEIVIEPIDALENPTIFLQSVADAFPIVQAVNRPDVKVLYDLYHEQRGAGNLIEKLQANLPLVSLVHIADVPGRHEPGTGEINYGAIYRQLAAMHYDRWIAMEFYATGDALAALRKARLDALAAFRA